MDLRDRSSSLESNDIRNNDKLNGWSIDIFAGVSSATDSEEKRGKHGLCLGNRGEDHQAHQAALPRPQPWTLT